MFKIAGNIQEFLMSSPEMERFVAVLFSGVFAVFHFIFGPILGSPYVVAIASLIFLDTMLGGYLAAAKKTFSFLAFFKRPLKKMIEYGIYIYVAQQIAIAPAKLVAIPITVAIYSYILLRESTSVLKNSSKVFDNKHMEALSEKAEDTLEDIIQRNKDKTSQNSERSLLFPGVDHSDKSSRSQ